ncbi:MAG TPA: GGDEF domain-containing protein [Thermoanaerobacterium sp.]|nr:GGDEF domain-containing protein [Thermoanaerobacterium sp.]
MDKITESEDIICILINQQRSICYSNVDKTIAEEHLSELHIFDYLPFDNTISYEIKYYKVTVYKFNLDKTMYYLAVIRLQDNLYKYAYRDYLTGLYNRNYWEQLKIKISEANLHKRFYLIIIDIDNLKFINDNKGHLEGDKVIKIVGQSIKESIRKDDIAIRYGGDEFFILISSNKMYVAQMVINRIRKSINKRCKTGDIRIEISAGTAYYNSVCNLENVIIMADKNMYKEKNRKKSSRIF